MERRVTRLEQHATTMQQIALAEIAANAAQPRKSFYQDSLEELAVSIKERGVLEPIVVRPLKSGGAGGARYEIVMGERRFRASRLAGLATIPAIVREMSDGDAAADALLENFQREDLNAIEKAQAIQGLLGFMSWEKVAKTLGVSETTLRRSLELLDLPAFVQYELTLRAPEPGETLLTEGHARMLACLTHDPPTQKRMVDKIKQERLNQSDSEKILQAIVRYPDKREAFLRVPLVVTDQILRALGARAERAKPYKPQTAEQHRKAIDKVATQLGDLLDNRLSSHLGETELNQLLSTCAEIERTLGEFNQRLRGALKAAQTGFQEVYVNCPLCGRVELVGSMRCSTCWSVLRRCYDCVNYDRPFERCSINSAQVYVSEAENPREYSKSYNCPAYNPRYEAQGVKALKMVA